MIRKVLCSCALSCALYQGVAFANESGNRFFIGLQGGYSSIYWKSVYPDNRNLDITSSYSRSNYGILGGYEMWLMENFGVRAYAIFGGVGATQIHFGGGVDAIYDFVETNGVTIGAFAGAQLEGAYWRYYRNDSPFGFNIGLNAGVRFSMDNHVAELVLKAPFLNNKVETIYHGLGSGSRELYQREMLSLSARYAYRF